MSVTARKAISWVVVALGISLGLVYLFFVAPVAFFTTGKNDSWPEISATAALLLSTLPASILAVFSRKRAGIWLTVVGLCGAAACAWNTHAVLSARGIHDQVGEVFGSTLLSLIAMLFGLFFWITGVLGWSNLRTRRPLAAPGEMDIEKHRAST